MKEESDARDRRVGFHHGAIEPAVIREQGGVVAVAKPPGLGTQAPPGLPSVESWLRGRVAPGAYVGVPHRLDRAVSGVVLLAVTPRAARTLSRQFERRQVRKTYLAIAAGGPPPAAVGKVTEWRDWIAKVADEPRARIAAEADEEAREAVTMARVAKTLGDATWLLELEPCTGRMHQLRVQAASRGLPIAGDSLYGSRLPFGGVADGVDPRLRPIALHAWRIEYQDPGSHQRVQVEAPLPSWWPAEARLDGGAAGGPLGHEGGIRPA